MVDFDKLIDKNRLRLETDPINIFKDLDTQSGKEILRPSQEQILKKWYSNYQDKKDILIKLPTGQGKTLIGMLMLQSILNKNEGPAIYLCPNSYLVDQTYEQANLFGINATLVESDGSLPRNFSNSKSILIANCKKLFNGMSKFGVQGSGNDIIDLGAIVLDDAHTCLEIIRNSFSINVNKYSNTSMSALYSELLTLFNGALSRQEAGTCMDILAGEDCFLPVPYWVWYDNLNEVLSILRKYVGEDKNIRIVWDVIKNNLPYCSCIISGKTIEISPRILPVELIPSFTNAKRRIFMSATLSEDAFLVKELGVDPKCVSNPLKYEGEVKYNGERLILIPSFVNPSIKRLPFVEWISNFTSKRGNFGVVSLVPTNHYAREWENHGAIVTSVKDLKASIGELKNSAKEGEATNIVTLVNEYDGVDLPDDTCRILILDQIPEYRSLTDSYLQDIRLDSKITNRKMGQRIEQGIGRGIRGLNDWRIVFIIGEKISLYLSNKGLKYLSKEAQKQIEIGDQLTDVIRSSGKMKDIEELVNQCLSRDKGWKEYYKEMMQSVNEETTEGYYLDHSILEREAEIEFKKGNVSKAIEILQNLISKYEDVDRGWYLHLNAIYLYQQNRAASMDIHLKAYESNNRLPRPERGVVYTKIDLKGKTRNTLIKEWIQKHKLKNEMILDVVNRLDKISFNISSDLFEEGTKDLGEMLGFLSDRPDKKMGEGPDNLWGIHNNRYFIIECKNRINEDRDEVYQKEIGQMSNSIGWFMKNYEGCEYNPIFIHPSAKRGRGAHVTQPHYVLQPKSLEKLRKNVMDFYSSFDTPIDTITEQLVAQKLNDYDLDLDNFIRNYLVRLK